jgi:hypothetical protein
VAPIGVVISSLGGARDLAPRQHPHRLVVAAVVAAANAGAGL